MRKRQRRRVARAAAAAGVIAAGAAVGLLVDGRDGGEGALPPTAPAPATDHRAPAVTDPPDSAPRTVETVPPEGKLFGFSDSSFIYTGLVPQRDNGVTAEQQVADLLGAGANAARIAFAWNGLEPRPGTYEQSYVERIKAFTDAFERAGGKVLITLASPPDWARAVQEGPTSAIAERPDAEEAYARMAAFVARTWPRAAGIETWNEPNTTIAWRGPGPQPERWVGLHRAAAQAIRREAPDIAVLLPGLAGPPADTRTDLGPQSFLKRMYQAGLRPDDYDALALHPYPIVVRGRERPRDPGGFAAQLDDFRLGHRRADPDARIWITETGATTTGPIAVSEARQAMLLSRLVRQLFSLDRVDAVFVHTLYEPAGLGGNDAKETGYGLLRPGQTGPERAKDAFCALRGLTRAPSATDACPNGR